MEQLTKRENEIVNLVALGYNNHEISKKLNITYIATEHYISQIFSKLNSKYNLDKDILNI